MISFEQRFPDAPSSAQALFAHILEKGASSRVEIARETGLARPTISESAERLLDAGLLKVLDKDAGATGKRGRIPELYDLADKIGTILTWRDLGSQLELAAYNLRKEQLAKACAPIQWSNHQVVEAAVQQLIKETEPHFDGPVLASAVSVVPPVHPDTQQIVEFDDPQHDGSIIDVHSLISNLTGAPVLVDNHVNWGLYSEYFQGVANDYSMVIAFSFGKDMGAAVAYRGHIIRGATGRTGELSRIVVENRLFKDIINDVAVHSTETGLSGFTYLDSEKTALRIINNPDDLQVKAYLTAFSRIAANQLMFSDAEAMVLMGPMADVPGFTEKITEVTQELIPWNIPIIAAQDGAHATNRGILLGAQRLALKSLGLGNVEEA